MYTLNPLNGGSRGWKSPSILRGTASARNACNLRHAKFHVRVFSQSGLVVQAFEFKLGSGSPSPSSFTFSPLFNSNPTWTPSLYYLTLQWPLCICAMPAWVARPAAESRLISTTINRPPLTMHAAKVAANPVEGSRRSPFSSTLVRSTLAMAKPVQEERLARGAPNQRHLVAQVANWQ